MDLSTTFLGEIVTLPIGIAPTATQTLAHPDGEQATAKGNISMQATYSLAGGPFYISLGCRKVKPLVFFFWFFFWGGRGWHSPKFCTGSLTSTALDGMQFDMHCSCNLPISQVSAST